MKRISSKLCCVLAALSLLTPPVCAQVGAGDSQANSQSTNSSLDSSVIEFIGQFEQRRNEAHEIQRSGDLQKAIELYDRNYELVRTEFGAKDILVSIAADDLAHALLTSGLTTEAVHYREVSFEICKTLARQVEEHWSDLNGETTSMNSKLPDTRYGDLKVQVEKVGGLNKVVLFLSMGLVYSLGGKFDKIKEDSIDTAWRLSAHIPDDPPTDAKCYLINIISLRYWPSNLNRSRLCLQKLVELASRAQDKSILQNAVRRLAKVCLAQADYLSVVKYATAALAIDKRFEEKANSPAQQEDVLLLARAAEGLHLLKDAQQRYEQLLRMYDEVPPSPQTQLLALEEWSGLLMSLGEFDQAYSGFLTCKERAKTIHGADSAEFAFDCQFLGWAAFKLNKFEEAERELKLALAIKTKSGIKNNDTFSMLSRFYSERGDDKQARDYLRHSIASAVSYLQRINDLPLAEQIAFLSDQTQSMLNQLLSECDTAGNANTELYEQVLSCRGLLIDSLHSRAKSMRRAKDDDVYKDLQQSVQENRKKLVALRAGSAHEEGVDVFQQLEALETSQRQLLEHVKTKYGKVEFEDCNSSLLQKHLTAGECLIDTYKFSDLKDEKTKYGAFLMRHEGPLQFIEFDLGSDLEQRLNDWVTAIRVNQKYNKMEKAPEGGTFRTTRSVVTIPIAGANKASELSSRAEFRKSIKPLTDALTTADKKLLICCDGELVRVPWSLLLDDRFLVAEIDNPKQLLERGSARCVTSGQEHFLLVGDVDFSSVGLPTLSASKGEVGKIFETTSKKAAVPPTVLTQQSANKQNVLESMTQNSFIHLATHGLFLSPLGERRDAESRQVGFVFSQRSPLLDSSVYVSSPANSELADAEITADEILNLDLTKTQHVVLSACETGLGESFRGQGVLGLRTAFSAAGAKTLLMSLWPVDDAATGDLMAEYYRQMFDEEKKPAEALREAQRLVRRENPSPYFWAGWVLVGDAW